MGEIYPEFVTHLGTGAFQGHVDEESDGEKGKKESSAICCRTKRRLDQLLDKKQQFLKNG